VGYPVLVGEEFHEMGVARCRVRMTHAPHLVPALWSSVELEVVGHRLLNTWEFAAMRVLTRFSSLHYKAVTPGADRPLSSRAAGRPQVAQSGPSHGVPSEACPRGDDQDDGEVHECPLPLAGTPG
jgi:hypothetical protein